jgi:hypothetical protein
MILITLFLPLQTYALSFREKSARPLWDPRSHSCCLAGVRYYQGLASEKKKAYRPLFRAARG